MDRQIRGQGDIESPNGGCKVTPEPLTPSRQWSTNNNSVRLGTYIASDVKLIPRATV
jgi:hypothetical protein